MEGLEMSVRNPQLSMETTLETDWWFEPLWKIWKSIGMIIPNIWENKKCSKPPTSGALEIISRTIEIWNSVKNAPVARFWDALVLVLTYGDYDG